MKTIVNLALVAAIACAMTLNAAPKPKMPDPEAQARHEAFLKMSPEEKEAYVAERKAKMMDRSGGYVRNTRNQEGRILIANAQSKVAVDDVKKSIKSLAEQLKISIDVEDTPGATPKMVRDLIDKNGTQAVIFILDNAECDIPMLIAPDSRWAEVNVAALGTGDVAGRTHKEVLRAFTFLCGGVASGYQNPMVTPITDVRQLDLIDSAVLPIDVVMRFSEYLKVLGVTPYVQATYRTACKQGWAPQPTNDVQKAIWEQTHAIPANPMRIEFDPKKGR